MSGIHFTPEFLRELKPYTLRELYSAQVREADRITSRLARIQQNMTMIAGVALDRNIALYPPIDINPQFRVD